MLGVVLLASGALGSALPPVPVGTQTSQAQQRPSTDPNKRKPDLGDAAEGAYRSGIISDSRGTGGTVGSPVAVATRRIGIDRVAVTTDSVALRGGEFKLEPAMGRILARATRPRCGSTRPRVR